MRNIIARLYSALCRIQAAQTATDTMRSQDTSSTLPSYGRDLPRCIEAVGILNVKLLNKIEAGHDGAVADYSGLLRRHSSSISSTTFLNIHRTSSVSTRKLEQGSLEMKMIAQKPRHAAATDSKSNRLRKSFISG